ncbi:MAG TPA: SCO family protein [Methylomirabilota bacterium]|nr:SCO family protein [Methylomirabilota bacterium]
MRPGSVATSAALFLVLCGGAAAAGAQHVHQPAPDAAPPRSQSIYEVSAALVDHRGHPVGLDLFRGHPVLISMLYASCRDACPLLLADIKRIEMDLPARVRADLRVLLVTLDPERDTPEALQALARAHRVDESRWRFVTAPDDTVREIAAVLGIKYRRLADGTINHSSVITLLDPSGVIQSRVEGIGQPHADLLRLLRASRAAPER